MAIGEISRTDFIKGVAAGVISFVVLGVLQAAEYIAQNYSAASEDTPGAEAGDGTGTEDQNLVSYTASAQGFSSEVTMTAYFDGTSIVSIELDVSGETPTVGGAAGDELISQCLEAQSADIDGVSGATFTSDAVRECLEACIAQAQGN